MKFTLLTTLLALFAALVVGSTTEQKPVVVSYPKDTPQNVLDAAMDAIRKAVRSRRHVGLGDINTNSFRREASLHTSII
jgi:hypothetical protein